MPATEKAFSKIDGTPVYYWRGTWGSTTPRTWYCTDGFYSQLVWWVRSLRSASSAYGGLSYIVSAGFYVNKTGQHGAGTAMDLDHLRWSGGATSSPIRQHHVASRKFARRYLAVEAITRRYFRYVLDGWYPNHSDHIHADFGGLPQRCVKSSESDTKFVQGLCNNHMSSGLAIDGDWGPLTQSAFSRAKSRLGISGDPHTSTTVWREFLSASARKGFADQPF